MKKVIVVFVMTLVLMSCTQQQKIGFVNSEKLITEYKASKKVETEMQALDLKIQQELPALVNTFRAKVSAYQKKMGSMTQAQRLETEQALGREDQILKQRQGSVQTQGRAAMLKISEKIGEFVKDYGKKNGYNMILGTVNVSGAVMYGDDTSDLTEIVLTALNADFDKGSDTKTPVKKEEKKTEEAKTEVKKIEETKK